MAMEMDVNERTADGVSVAQQNKAAGSGQGTLVVAIEDSVAPASEVAAGATPAEVRSVQVRSDAGSQHSTCAGGACEEMEVEGVEMGQSAGGEKPAIVTDAIAVAPPDRVKSDMLAKVKELMKKLKTENLLLHGELVVERMAYTRSLMNNIRRQRDRKKAVGEKEEIVRLLAAKRAKRENGAVVEPL